MFNPGLIFNFKVPNASKFLTDKVVRMMPLVDLGYFKKDKTCHTDQLIRF